MRQAHRALRSNACQQQPAQSQRRVADGTAHLRSEQPRRRPEPARACPAWQGHDDAAADTLPDGAAVPASRHTAASHAQTDAAPAQAAPLNLKYKRVMLKLSGEALEGKLDFGIDPLVLRTVAKEVAIAARQGVEIAIVVGGGNFFRGVNRWKGLERTTADYVGMLATVMNAITLQNAIEQEGLEVRVQTAIEMREVAEPYIRRRAIRHLERGRVVIFGAGTGNPFFTTDTAAALRAAEIGAEVYLKATQVDGIYDCDPRQNPSARKYTHISYRKCVMDDIKVLDETAFTLCKENDIPVLVFDLHESGNVLRAVQGMPSIGTVVDAAPDLPEDISPCNDAAVQRHASRGMPRHHPERSAANNSGREWAEACL